MNSAHFSLRKPWCGIGLRYIALAMVAIGLVNPGRADVRVIAINGEDRWSQQVSTQWLARTRQVMATFDGLARTQYGVDVGARLNLVLAATPKAVLPQGSSAATRRLELEAGLSEPDLRQRALVEPVRLGMLAVVDELTAGSRQSLPIWLPDGLAELLAQQLVADLALPALPPHAVLSPITRFDGVEARPATDNSQRRRPAADSATIGLTATKLLQQRLGEAFHPRVRAYLAAYQSSVADAEAAFAQHFGIAPRDLLQQAEQTLHAAGGGQANGSESAAAAAPPSVQLVATLDTSRDKPEIAQAEADFRAAPKPRALALSPDGRWGLGAGSPRAADRALSACQTQGGNHCRLFAQDDEVVWRPGRAQVLVQMGGYANDEFARQVEREWLGPVRQASAQFDRLVNDTLRVQLSRDARIYIGAGASDYEQILIRDMDLNPARAEAQGEATGGLSNSRGQIAVKFTPGQNRAAAYERAVKTTLHELTHELQKQLDNNHAGFKPPAWLREGTADLIAFMLAPQVRLNDAAAEPLRDWRLRNLNWWRNANKTELQPDDMVGLSDMEWTRMTRERRGVYQMAGLMCLYLQAITGERFLPGWVEYYRLAGQRRQSASRAFEQAFGLSEAEFHADFKRWLMQQ